MSKKINDDEIREIATKRVRARRGFYWHLTVYVVVNLMLIAIWYFTGGRDGGYFWPMWVLLGWGIGLVFNAVAVFARGDVWSERQAIEKEIEKIKKSGA
jgi:uncharacterized membrane protein